MDEGAAVQIGSQGDHARKEGNMVLNPADDSSSSYESTSTNESGPQKVMSFEMSLSTSKNMLASPARPRKVPSTTLAAVTSDFNAPNTEGKLFEKIDYSDDRIKADAARWAATFKGPVDSENISQDEIGRNPTSRPSRSKSRKRKAEKLKVKQYKSNYPKGIYNDSYRRLLNEEIRDVTLSTVDTYDRLPQTRVGMTEWSSDEKNSFFIALSRLGKDNVRSIASRIGSKSELEVQEYIQLLQQGLLEKISTEPRRQLLGLTDIPAAIQISQECCDELDKAADALCSRQNRYEEHKEKRRWGESWLLNSDVNLWIEKHLAEDGGSHDLKEVLPAAELLNLRNWLDLSNRVFMNPAAPRQDENWHFIAGPGEEPSIRATAFIDFHRLAVSVTKRLVSSAIFCAMSRLRATDSTSFHRYDMVKPADVVAAAKITGLEIDSSKFWRDCPRRCQLKIIKSMKSAGPDQSPMDYDVVESILNKRNKFCEMARPLDGETSRPTSHLAATILPDFNGSKSSDKVFSPYGDRQFTTEGVEMDSTARNLAFEYWQGVDSGYDGPIDPSGSEYEGPHTRGNRTENQIKAKEALDRAHLEYTEALDIQASLLEEQRLWSILKREPPFAIKPEEIELSNRPIQERKEEDELNDWRDRIQFWSHWETSDQPLPVNAFSRTQAQTSERHPSVTNTEVDRSSFEGGTEEMDSEMIHGEISSNEVNEDKERYEDRDGNEDNDDGNELVRADIRESVAG